jgi:hypothetical protein
VSDNLGIHTGYDYSDPSLIEDVTKVYAAEEGYLCIANNIHFDSNNTNQYSRAPVCTINNNEQTTVTLNTDSINGGTQWDSYGAVYIIHPNGYSSWYVHMNQLLDTIDSLIKKQGYVLVTKHQQIGTVGSKGAGGRVHLHFGVKDGVGNRDNADPYGNGRSGNFNVLWELWPEDRPDNY